MLSHPYVNIELDLWELRFLPSNLDIEMVISRADLTKHDATITQPIIEMSDNVDSDETKSSVESLLQLLEQESEEQQEQVTEHSQEIPTTPEIAVVDNSTKTVVSTDTLPEAASTAVKRKHNDTDTTPDNTVNVTQTPAPEEQTISIGPALDNTTAVLITPSPPFLFAQRPFKFSNAPVSYASVKKQPSHQKKNIAKKTPRHTAPAPVEGGENSEDRETLPPKPKKRRTAKKHPKSVDTEDAQPRLNAATSPPSTHTSSVPAPTYCHCSQPDTGALMIACDQPGCAVEWYHGPCVGVYEPSKEEKWYCPSCVNSEGSKGGKGAKRRRIETKTGTGDGVEKEVQGRKAEKAASRGGKRL